MASGSKLHTIKAHQSRINALKILNDNLLVSGDESGCVKLWDLRQQKSINAWTDNKDYISDFDYIEGKHAILVTSGDGTLSVYDTRKAKKPVGLSENQDDELLSVAVCKNGKKVVVGSQSGILSIFTWGQFLDSTDRFPGHPQYAILPNKFDGVVGVYDDGFPVERVRLDAAKKYVASCSHDNYVRIWDIDAVKEAGPLVPETGLDGGDSDDEVLKEKRKRRKLKLSDESSKADSAAFYSGLD